MAGCFYNNISRTAAAFFAALANIASAIWVQQ